MATMVRASVVVAWLGLAAGSSCSGDPPSPAPAEAAANQGDQECDAVEAAVGALRLAIESQGRERLLQEYDRLRASIASVRARARRLELASQAWFEVEVADCLIALGQVHDAHAGLRAHFAMSSPAPGSKADRPFADGLSLLAEIELWLGDYEAAQDALRRALPFAHRAATDRVAHAEHSLALCHEIEGRILIALGVLGEAEVHLSKQQEIAKTLGDPRLQQRAAIYAAELALACSRPDTALDHLAGVDASAHDANLVAVRGIAQWLRARQLQASAGRGEAAACRARAIGDLTAALADRGLARSLWQRSQIALAHCFEDAGDSEQAAAKIMELRQVGVDAPPSGGRASTAFVAEVEGLASRLCRLGSPTKAEQAAQRLRHEHAYAALLREWRSAPVRRAGISFLSFAERRDLLVELILMIGACLDDSVDAADAAEAAIAAVLRAQRQSSLARELLGGTEDETSLALVRERLLHPGDGALIFVGGHFSSVLLGLDRTSAWMVELPGTSTLARQVIDLAAALAGEPSAEQGAAAAALSAKLAGLILPEAVRRHMANWRHVLIADHGFLHGLPWEILPWSDEQLVGERFAVFALSSLPLGLHLQARAAPVPVGHATVDLFATLTADAELIPAAHDRRQLTDQELARLTAPYASHTQLVNAQLTRTALVQHPRQGTVLQLLAHGYVPTTTEPVGQVLLSPSDGDRGVLDAARVESLHWPRVVFVSSCGLGRGLVRVGDETFQSTLSSSFLRAGAHTVVHARADLSLAAHLRLLGIAHRELARGRSPAQALQIARHGLAREGAPWHERYAHAQVQVVGLGHVAPVRD